MTTKKQKDVIEFQLPERFLSYLINNDKQGLYDNELEKFNIWLIEQIGDQKGYWSYDSKEAYFNWCNDFDSLGGNVVDLEFVIMSDR